MSEIKALMAKMLPTAEKLHTYMHRAKATEKEREAEIAALEKAVAAGKVTNFTKDGMSLSSRRSNGTWRKQHKKRETIPPTTKIVSYGIPLTVFWCVANAVQP